MTPKQHISHVRGRINAARARTTYDSVVALSSRDSETIPAASTERAPAPRVAFFGGSFDPPHLGHLAVARAAREALDLDTVLFAPVGAQPLKPHGSTAPFADRLAMTRLAIAGEPGFGVSLLDAPADDARPNYTLDTLRTLRAEFPPGGLLFCLMGADSFLSLRRWHGAAEIPFVASLVVASRPGQHLDDLTSALPAGLALQPGSIETSAVRTPQTPSRTDARSVATSIPMRTYMLRRSDGQTAPFYLLPELDVEISASDIRRQVGCCFDDPAATQDLLPAAVSDYIRTHALYR